MRRRIQTALFPTGLEWFAGRFGNPVTCLGFYNLEDFMRGDCSVVDQTGFEPVTS
jgi:hypothetical protein